MKKKFKTIAPDQPIRLAFLGCGFATRIHSKTLKKFKNVQCYYASRSLERAEQYRTKYKGAGAFDAYEAAIASNEIDVIFIATPPDSHLELCLLAMKAGKHVIIEKPPFFKSSDFDTIMKLQEKTQTQVMIAENYFYKPALKKLRSIIETDVIGDIKFLYFNATKTQKTGDWRDESQMAGGGALFEGGIHWINFVSNLGLNVKSVKGFHPGAPQKMERSIQAAINYEEGAIGTLLYSWEINALINGLRISRIYGTKGSITFESNGIFIFVRGKKWKFTFPGFLDIAGYKGMFRDFFQALRKGEEPTFNLELAKRDLLLIEKIYKW